MIELRGVRVAYGRTLALDSVDLEVAPGIAGVFGPNGAGKSTLLRAVAGLVRPAAGSVSVLGLPPARARGLIGYAGHSPGLYPQLTVAENLALFARLHGAPPDRVPTVIEALGLGGRARTRAGELSAGYRSRAAVARALVHDPAVLLLDEPYANQDDDGADLVSAALVAWRSGVNIALVATHGAKRLKPFADARVIVRRGRVAESLTAEDIARRVRAR